jgi:hypothetical protein
MQSELDALIQEKFNLPSYEVFDFYVKSGELESLRRRGEEARRLNLPETQAGLETIQSQQGLETAQAYGQLRGPEQAGFGQALTDDFNRQMAERRARGDLGSLTYEAQRQEQILAPAVTRSEIALRQAQAQKAVSPAVQEAKQDMEAFLALYGPEQGPIEWAQNRVTGLRTKAGELPEMPQVQAQIQELALAITNIMDPGIADPMAAGIFALVAEKNPGMFGKVKKEDAQTMTREEIAGLLIGRFKALDKLHKLVHPDKLSYLETTNDSALAQILGRQTGGPVADLSGKRAYSNTDIDAAIGSLTSVGTGFINFTSPEIGALSKRYLLNQIIQKYEPRQWEVALQANRPGFIQRSSEQDFNAAVDIIREMYRSAGGNE